MNPELPVEIAFSRTKAEPVPAALRLRARETVARYLVRARQLYRRGFPMPTVSFDLRGTTAGQAYSQRNHVRLNAVLYQENVDDFIADTIPHEVAHLIARQLHQGIQPHGPEWQAVMRDFGIEPKRTHSYDTKNARTTRMFPYRCDCRDHELSAARHNKARRGAVYRCKACGGALRFQGAARAPTPVVRPLSPSPNPTRPPLPTRPSAPARPAETPPPLRPPTPRMLAYARDLAAKARVALPPEVGADFEACRQFIDRLRQAPGEPRQGPVPPTPRQLEYAQVIARRKGLTLTPEQLADKAALSAWIGQHAG